MASNKMVGLVYVRGQEKEIETVFNWKKNGIKLVTGTKIWLEVGQDGGKSYKSLGKVLGSSKELAKLGKCGGK